MTNQEKGIVNQSSIKGLPQAIFDRVSEIPSASSEKQLVEQLEEILHHEDAVGAYLCLLRWKFGRMVINWRTMIKNDADLQYYGSDFIGHIASKVKRSRQHVHFCVSCAERDYKLTDVKRTFQWLLDHDFTISWENYKTTKLGGLDSPVRHGGRDRQADNLSFMLEKQATHVVDMVTSGKVPQNKRSATATSMLVSAGQLVAGAKKLMPNSDDDRQLSLNFEEWLAMATSCCACPPPKAGFILTDPLRIVTLNLPEGITIKLPMCGEHHAESTTDSIGFYERYKFTIFAWGIQWARKQFESEQPDLSRTD